MLVKLRNSWGNELISKWSKGFYYWYTTKGRKGGMKELRKIPKDLLPRKIKMNGYRSMCSFWKCQHSLKEKKKKNSWNLHLKNYQWKCDTNFCLPSILWSKMLFQYQLQFERSQTLLGQQTFHCTQNWSNLFNIVGKGGIELVPGVLVNF